MNPNDIRTMLDQKKVNNRYLVDLNLQIANKRKMENAVITLQTTGVSPVHPTDTRTIDEKLLDVEAQKRVLQRALLDITDGSQVSKIMNTITDRQIVYLTMIWDDFSKMVKQKFTIGIPAAVFTSVLERYIRDYETSLLPTQSGKTTEQLLLSMTEMMREMPNIYQLNDLISVIQNVPSGAVPLKMKQMALTSARDLASLMPTSQTTLAIDNLNPIDKLAAQTAVNDGLSAIGSAVQIQQLTAQLQQAQKPKQIETVLSDIIKAVLLSKDDKAKLEDAAALAEQTELATSKIEQAQKAEVFKQQEVVKSNIRGFEGLAEEEALPQPVAAAVAKAAPAYSQQMQDDLDMLDDLNTSADDLNKLSVARLRSILITKSKEGHISSSKSEINKTKKPELVAMAFSLVGRISITLPVKAKAKAKAKASSIFANVEWTKDVTLADFEKLDYADKRSMLEDMDTKGMLRDEMSVDAYKEYGKLMNRNDTNEEGTLIDVFDYINKAIGGSGLKKTKESKRKKITFGCGLVRKPTLMVKHDNIDFEKGIKREAAYIPIGKYVINKQKLRDNMLLMRTVKGGQIAELPQMSISPHLGKMLNKIINGHGFPSHNDLTEMEDSDKDILYKVFKMSKAQGIEAIPRPNKSKDEQEFNRFTILKGQILAGNNSKELIKEFKTLLVKLIHSDKILRKDGHAILLDFAALGF
jgi:hypothetical protein